MARIRAYVLLCWLALPLICVVETTCADTWPNLRRELERLSAVARSFSLHKGYFCVASHDVSCGTPAEG